jgi:hypothetical protein
MNYAILILALACAPLLPLVATGYFWFARWKCRKVAVSSGLKGREAALRLLSENGLTDIQLSGRASEAQREKLAADGIKVYRAKISKRSNVVYIISIIEAPRPFSSGQAKEVLEMLTPSTPVAVSGRYIYCNAGRPDPRSMSDEVIWMPPQELYESLGR